MKQDNRKASPDTALITGAGRGIGRAAALRLAEACYNLSLCYASGREACEETASLCREMGSEVLILQGRVESQDDAKRMVAETIARFGSLEILVNNAGINRDNILLRMSEEDMRTVLDVDLIGAFHMMKEAARPMIRAHYGRIINISSVSGRMGIPGQANYSAAKAGVIGLTRSFAREACGRNITVNAVAPGFIDTDMTKAMTEEAKKEALAGIPAGRAGRPEEVAELIAFLADRRNGYITGQVISIDGGMCIAG